MPSAIATALNGIHVDNLIGNETPEPLDGHPGKIVWDHLISILNDTNFDENLVESEWEEWASEMRTLRDGTSTPNYDGTFDDWCEETPPEKEKTEHDADGYFKFLSAYYGGRCIQIHSCLSAVDNCLFQSLLFDDFSSNTQFFRLIMYLMPTEGELHSIYRSHFMTVAPVVYAYLEPAVFQGNRVQDLDDECDETQQMLVENLPNRSAIQEVTTDGTYPVVGMQRKTEIVAITSDDTVINYWRGEGYVPAPNFKAVPEETLIPLTVSNFHQALWPITNLRLVSYAGILRFMSGQSHPGALLSVGMGTGSGYDQYTEESPFALNGNFGVIDQNDEEVYLICLRIMDSVQSFAEILPESISYYKSHHEGMNIVVAAYGRGMFEPFSEMLYTQLSSTSLLQYVEELLHLTANGEYKTTAKVDTASDGWIVTDPDPSVEERRGYWYA
jgi:hypothetical protein